MFHDATYVTYFIILHAVEFSLHQSLEWEQWSFCSKSCDVGIRSRHRYDNTTKQTEIEKQYCNFQYCPDIIKRCNSSVERYCSDVIIHHGYPICKENKCFCKSDFFTGGPEYNPFNCMMEIGNCVMRDTPPSALGFADPSVKYTAKNSLYSCTTNDNNATEVHVIGIGHSDDDIFDVTILSRGPTNKPIILALTSNAGITWRIKTSLQIKELLFMFEPVVDQCKRQLTCQLLPGSKTATKQEPWSEWTHCSKSCGIGKIRRERCVLNKDVIELQEYYCNLNHCPSEKESCTSSPCTLISDSDSSGICINGTCRCPFGSNYTANECYQLPGNCIIYLNSQIALGFIDPPVPDQELYSCINGQNAIFEVHVISVFGNQSFNVSITPIGQVSKPIILVLASYKPVNWNLNITVGIYELIVGDYSNHTSTLSSLNSRCGFKHIKNTLPITKLCNDVDLTSRKLLAEIVRKYGPITSYTGYHKPINGRDSFLLKLKVGGDPFMVLPKEYEYNLSSVRCTPIEPTTTTTTTTTTPKPTTTAIDFVLWSPWTKCSKDCDIGTRSRRGVLVMSNMSFTQKQYCNLQYCPVLMHYCSGNGSCQLENFSLKDGRCKNGICLCGLGTGYHPTNCLPVFGNCTVRKNSKISLVNVDRNSTSFSDMFSCTADDNPVYEVHVIIVHEKIQSKKHNINLKIKRRGAVTKPIVIALKSYASSKWWITSDVPLYKIITNFPESVVNSPSSLCDFKSATRGYWFNGYGDDRNGGNTIRTVQTIALEYGPVTSFTGFYEFKSLSATVYDTITLFVGGDPLLVEPYEINSPRSDCSPILPATGTEIPPLPPIATFAMVLPVTTLPTVTTMQTDDGESSNNVIIAVIVVIVVIIVCVIIGCCIARSKSSTPRSRSTIEQDENNRFDRPLTTPSAPPIELTRSEPASIPSSTNNYSSVPNHDFRTYSDDPPSYEIVMKMSAKDTTSI